MRLLRFLIRAPAEGVYGLVILTCAGEANTTRGVILVVWREARSAQRSKIVAELTVAVLLLGAASAVAEVMHVAGKSERWPQGV